VPAVPTGATATAISSSQINLAWNAVTPPSGCSVTYNVYRGATATFTQSAANQIASGLSTPAFNDPGRTASTTFFYIIEAVDGAGSSITRASATTMTGGGTGCAAVPSPVTNLVASAVSTSQINLTWSAVTAPLNCSVTYSVHRSTTANFTPSTATLVSNGLTAPSLSNTGLVAGTTYFFAVTADDAFGSSALTRASTTTVSPGTGTCHVGFNIVNSWSTGFQVGLSIQNTGTAPINGWVLTWTFPGAQQVSQLWNGTATQTGAGVSVTNLSYNATIAPSASYNDAGFTGAGTAGTPTNFAINGVPCQ
jgi:cellulose 1,4-beta-cellobiosidase